uniref:GG12151 n=1 Tax=Drosophila erecta TaxID=7220 RepID=B3P875_DROER
MVQYVRFGEDINMRVLIALAAFLAAGDNFGTIKCHDYQAALANECGSTYSGVRMGAINNAYMVEGDFYVPVNGQAPFGKTE